MKLKDYPDKRQLAVTLGVSLPAIYHWASGRNRPLYDTVLRLEALGIELPAVTPPEDPFKIRDSFTVMVTTETVQRYLRLLDRNPNGLPAVTLHPPTRAFMRDAGLIELFYSGQADKRLKLRPVAAYRITAKGRDAIK